MHKKLSILICSLKSRKKLLDELLYVLEKQIDDTTPVELILNVDNGEKTIGEKRNELIQKANGEYSCFVDDDDMVSDDYIYRILTAIQTHQPDCCGIEGYIYETKKPKLFIHSIKYNEWYHSNNTYYRYPNHLNPIKTDLIKNIGFENISHGEDKIFSDKIKNILKTEFYIKGVIYHYIPSKK
jgi:glycosyltransferase involved in cell wall biosynthesis